MSRSVLAVPLVALALVGVACGSDDDGETESGAATTAQSQTDSEPAAEQPQPNDGGGGGGAEAVGPDGLEIGAGRSQFGTILFDQADRAIYLFDKETSATSECYGECAAAWPPVLSEGEPQAAGGAEAKLLGTTERDDGTTQVTYNGQPLYYYVDDPSGEVVCHNVDEFGGLWLVVEPSGEAVQ